MKVAAQSCDHGIASEAFDSLNRALVAGVADATDVRPLVVVVGYGRSQNDENVEAGMEASTKQG